MRHRLICAHMRAIADDARPAGPKRRDLESRSDHRGAVLHGAQPESLCALSHFLYASTVIADLQPDVLPLDIQRDLDGVRMASATMPSSSATKILRAAIER